MSRHVSVLLLGLLLLLAGACSKKDSEPGEPRLEGRWNFTRETETFVAQGTRTLIRDTLLPTGHRLELTPTTWTTHNPSQTPVVNTYTYTRQGDILLLRMPPSAGYSLITQVTIVELTASSLHLQYSSLRSVYDDYYTR